MQQTKPEQALPPWDWAFLAPAYWPTWLLIGLLKLASLLPCVWRARLGATLGDLLRLLLVDRRRVAATNLRLCFPDLDAAEHRRLLRRHFQALGQGFVDMGVAWWGDGERLRSDSQVEGMQHLTDALDGGRGVILVAGHFTTMEVGVRILTLFAPVPWVYSIYRRSKNRLFERVMLRGRSSQPAVMFAREEVRTMIAALRGGMPVCFFPDQDHGRRNSVFLPFCGVPAATITTTARFARMTGARIVPYFQERLADGRGYRLRVLPALQGVPSGDDAADTAHIASLIEAEVRARPHEYYWIHRRFKTRPEPSDDVYQKRSGGAG